jgi:tetratricopeptide (TPR) repeat protein
MTEVLISDLAQLKGWRVISRTSTEAYRETNKSIAQIAGELNVDLIIEGSVTKAGDRVRVVTQLIDAKTDEHLWARTYDRSMNDVFALQSELAREIAKSVKAAVPPEHQRRLDARAAFDPAVYDLYLRGRHAWNLRTPEGLSAAVGLFNQAVEREPDFALPHVGLADAYILGGTPSTGRFDARERVVRARASAERALALAGHMAESHTSHAAVLFFGDRDVAAAEQEFRRAIELNPNYPLARQWFAILLAEQRRDREALEHAEAAVGLDPMEATFHQALGLVHYYGLRYGAAVAAQRRAIELRTQLPFARVMLIKSLVMNGELAAAVRECGDTASSAAGNVELQVNCAIALHRAGDPRARAHLDRLRSQRPAPAAALLYWHAATGDLDRAFELVAALRSQDNLPPNLRFDPMFEPLRADARYAKLIR